MAVVGESLAETTLAFGTAATYGVVTSALQRGDVREKGGVYLLTNLAAAFGGALLAYFAPSPFAGIGVGLALGSTTKAAGNLTEIVMARQQQGVGSTTTTSFRRTASYVPSVSSYLPTFSSVGGYGVGSYSSGGYVSREIWS